MGFWKYIRGLIKANNLDSSKSFAMVVSVLIGALMGIGVLFCIIWDVVKNGYVKSDLESMGIFLLCVGGYMVGGSVSKIVSERARRKGFDFDHKPEDERCDRKP